MHLRPRNVFKAICYGHDCSIETGARPSGRASLVDISAASARLLLLADAETGAEAPMRRGEPVTLHPRFRKATEFEAIPGRVLDVRGRDVSLRFETPLPLTGARLVALTRR